MKMTDTDSSLSLSELSGSDRDSNSDCSFTSDTESSDYLTSEDEEPQMWGSVDVNARATRKKRAIESRPRKKRVFVDYHTSIWWLRYVVDVRAKDPTSAQGKLFRRRFRLPYPMYERILGLMRNDDEYDWEALDCTKDPNRVAPLELKVLSALRILGTISTLNL